MKHKVTPSESELIAEKLLLIAKQYTGILAILGTTEAIIQVNEFRHRLQPDGLLELEAFLSDNSQIRIEFIHTEPTNAN
jgi:hypothetical protein